MSLPLDRAATILDCLEHYARTQPEARAYTFVADGERDERVLSYAELDRRSRRLAHHLVASGCRGKAVVLLFPSGLEFVVAFFACLRAGAIAVPANLTRNAQHFARLRLIIHDSGAAMVLTLANLMPSVENGLRVAGLEADAVDVVSEAHCRGDAARNEPLPTADPQGLAFLQYTSGSTGAPKGVMVSHAQLIANTRAIRQAGQLPEHAEVGGWLPQFHDMGLIGTTLQPIALGGHYAFMAPLHFIHRPLRWLQLMSRFRSVASAAPNFALRLCVKAAEAGGIEGLDLGTLQAIFCGAEPVDARVVQQFVERFAGAGLRPTAVRPCYGLAEATLLVSGGDAADAAGVLSLDREQLARGRAVPVADGTGQACVCCGAVAQGHEVSIVDPQTGARLGTGAVGEVWVRGPSVASGYWRNAASTARDFNARLSDGTGPFLRTGDLGFMRSGGLYITGRAKEMMIVRGRNHYPNDIEQTLVQALASQWSGTSAVFSFDHAGEEKVVAVLEAPRRQTSLHRDAAAGVAAVVRHAVAQVHELQLADVVLLSHGAIPRTSSGKTQRLQCSRMYAEGSLLSLALPLDDPHRSAGTPAADLQLPV